MPALPAILSRPAMAPLSAAALLLAAAAGHAQETPAAPPETYAPPAGCTGFLTVQMRGCVVANHYTCTADPAGDQWDVLFDMTGPFHLSRIDAETQWVETVSLPGGEADWLQEAPADPASFSALLDTGLDTYDFSTVSDAGTVTTFRGQDALNGRTVTIDGITLEQTEFRLTATDAGGAVLWRRAGTELISRDWRMFLSDVQQLDGAEGLQTIVSTPVEFTFPGEPDFFTTRPKYDCDALLARRTDPPSTPPGTEEATHDQL